ncbi:MAG: zinc-ribbon domain-containing protein [Candidatus Methanoperedens sp.]
MYCNKCGTQNSDDANFCFKCGIEFNSRVINKNEQIQHITLGLILSWIIGVLLGLAGMGFIVEGSIGAGIPLILISIILIPPLNKLIEDAFSFKFSSGAKIALCMILFFIYAIFIVK